MVTDTAAPGHLEAAPARRARLTAALLGLLAVLVLTCMASLALGVRDVPLGQVLDAIFWPDLSDNDHSVVLDERLPRTVLGLIGGAALGARRRAACRDSPATRSPTLGCSASTPAPPWRSSSGDRLPRHPAPTRYVWFAFVGAAVAAVLVYGVASLGLGRRDAGASSPWSARR